MNPLMRRHFFFLQDKIDKEYDEIHTCAFNRHGKYIFSCIRRILSLMKKE